jgi:ABC-type nitrate/sulfonate/bicarbonate transport system substrate-binding protein
LINKIAASVMVCLGMLLVACAEQPSVGAVPKNAPAIDAARQLGTIRFSLQGTANVPDIPWLMALDSLKEQGYIIELINLTSADLITGALIRSDIEVGAASTSFSWSAIAKGADIRTIVGRVNMTFSLVTKQTLLTCQDLDGKILAFSSKQAVGYLMFEKYLKQHCLGIAPQIILMSESKNRVAGLLANEIDGAYLEIEDWVSLKRESPKFHILIDFAKEFPEVQYSTFSVRHEWAQQNPGIVKDYIRALILANRRIMVNAKSLEDGIVKYLSLDRVQAQALATAYIAAGVWDINGGLTQDNLQKTMEFMASSGSVPQGLQVGRVANLAFLNTVLDEIGRK